ncbi:MAG: hypothetical protein COA61_001605 [Zetaproteobacteria bacterium]|nr:hypothetical protein [Zetaproteobacteria bacterium]
MSKFLPLLDGLKLSHPLKTMSDDRKVQEAQYIWEHESLGGIAENNNPLPRPVVGLLILTFITAIAWTFPLFGQRPNAAIYADYITLMHSAPVQQVMNDKTLTTSARDEKAMKMIVGALADSDSPYEFQRIQHPISMNDLRIMEPGIIELQNQHADLREYSIIGNDVALANFEGNWKTDANGNFLKGPDGKKVRERLQPWWDKGYMTSVYYFFGFCFLVIITVKRLPPITWKPDHSIAH